MTENKRFTVPLKYSLSHSKIQCDGTPLTNDELVRILNTNDGAFLENFNLKKENKELKETLLSVLNQLYSSESSLIYEYSTNISNDEKELAEYFEEKYSKYGWKND